MSPAPASSPRPALNIEVTSAPPADWDPFVANCSTASIYHRSAWLQVIAEAFGHRIFFVTARTSTRELSGVLPLVQQRGLLGNFLTSIPFFNYGGALGDADSARALMEHARGMAIELRCSYVEFRDTATQPGDWRVRTDKVAMLLSLPADAAALSTQLGAKLRSQIKRAERESPAVRTGGVELLPDFYDVFCRNMRDLGTPVYPRRFFETLLRKFSAECLLVVIDRAGQPAAAGFLVMANGRAEIPWAACRADAKPAGFNMRLYWEVLLAAVGRGCNQFDFGRSTIDSGTFRFKKQWGAQPVQLYWHRWERKALPENAGGASERGVLHYATLVWQRLPLGIANTLGPLLSPGLPW